MSTVGFTPPAAPPQVEADRPLTGLEWGFLQLRHRHPGSSSEIAALLRFGAPVPSLGEVRQHLAGMLLATPESRRILWWPRGPRCRPWWRLEAPVLEERVRQRVLPSGGGQSGLLAAVEDLMAEPIPAGTHPWQCWLLDGYSDREWALLVKLDHAIADGASGWALARRCFGGSPAGMPPRSPVPRRSSRRFADLWTAIRGAPQYAGGFFPLAPRSFRRMALTGRRTLAITSVGLDRLREIGQRHGATVNDVFLAALCGALRAWPATPWRRGVPEPLWTLVPVDIRALDGSRSIGNRLASTRCRLPCEQPDPAARLDAILRASTATKRSGRANHARASTNSFPTRMVRLAFRWSMSTRYANLLASNMPASQEPLAFGDRSLRDGVAVGLLPPGQPLSAYLTTVAGRASLCVVVDKALPRGDELCRLWLAAIDELDRILPTIERRVPLGGAPAIP